MDALYILGRGSKWDNNELRYSLRSLARHVHGLGRVFVVGTDPKWLSDAVTYVAKKDASAFKEFNIAEKIAWTFQHTDISNDVLFLNDDHFLLRNITAATYPYFHRGPLLNATAGRVGAVYRMCLINTHKMLAASGRPQFHFDVHTPIRYNRQKFLGLSRTWQDSLKKGKYGYVVKSSYCNLTGVLAEHKWLIRDCKINGFVKGIDEVRSIVQHRHVFSCDDAALDKGVREFLMETYPEKSIYER